MTVENLSKKPAKSNLNDYLVNGGTLKIKHSSTSFITMDQPTFFGTLKNFMIE